MSRKLRGWVTRGDGLPRGDEFPHKPCPRCGQYIRQVHKFVDGKPTDELVLEHHYLMPTSSHGARTAEQQPCR